MIKDLKMINGKWYWIWIINYGGSYDPQTRKLNCDCQATVWGKRNINGKPCKHVQEALRMIKDKEIFEG
jgi:hypothetical protein